MVHRGDRFGQSYVWLGRRFLRLVVEVARRFAEVLTAGAASLRLLDCCELCAGGLPSAEGGTGREGADWLCRGCLRGGEAAGSEPWGQWFYEISRPWWCPQRLFTKTATLPAGEGG